MTLNLKCMSTKNTSLKACVVKSVILVLTFGSSAEIIYSFLFTILICSWIYSLFANVSSNENWYTLNTLGSNSEKKREPNPLSKAARFPLTSEQSSHLLLFRLACSPTSALLSLLLKNISSHLLSKHTFKAKLSELCSPTVHVSLCFILIFCVLQVVTSTLRQWLTSWRVMQSFTEVWEKVVLFCVQSNMTPSGSEVIIQM